MGTDDPRNETPPLARSVSVEDDLSPISSGIIVIVLSFVLISACRRRELGICRDRGGQCVEAVAERYTDGDRVGFRVAVFRISPLAKLPGPVQSHHHNRLQPAAGCTGDDQSLQCHQGGCRHTGRRAAYLSDIVMQYPTVFGLPAGCLRSFPVCTISEASK